MPLPALTWFRSTWHRCLAAAMLLAAVLAAHGPAAAQTVRLGGTGSALGTMARLAQAYRLVDPTFQLEVVPNLGSGGGVKALGAGAVQIAVTSRPLKAEELAPGFTAIEYARSAFVLVTARSGTVGPGGLSRAQLADIYAGRQTRWDDGQPVRLVLRPRNDSDNDLLAEFSPAMPQALAAALGREGMVVGLTDQEAVDAVERLPGGLGTATLSLLLSESRRSRALSLDGVEPSAANVISGRYPYAKRMFMVIGPQPAPAVLRFIAFVTGKAGQRVLAETGHAPVAASH